MYKPEGKLISLDDEIDDVSQVFHCDGLLLFIAEDNTKLMVWNPYWGKIRWIEPTHNFDVELNFYSYALGHDKCNQSYKILKFVDCYCGTEYKTYDCNSDSWRVLDVTSDRFVAFYDSGVSLKGNTYWFARKKDSKTRERNDSFL